MSNGKRSSKLEGGFVPVRKTTISTTAIGSDSPSPVTPPVASAGAVVTASASRVARCSSNRRKKLPSVDVSILERPLQLGRSDAVVVARALQDGTAELRKVLVNECDLIFECRVCRGLFRSLANFLGHKRQFCRQSCTTGNDGDALIDQQPSTSSLINVATAPAIGYYDSAPGASTTESNVIPFNGGVEPIAIASHENSQTSNACLSTQVSTPLTSRSAVSILTTGSVLPCSAVNAAIDTTPTASSQWRVSGDSGKKIAICSNSEHAAAPSSVDCNVESFSSVLGGSPFGSANVARKALLYSKHELRSILPAHDQLDAAVADSTKLPSGGRGRGRRQKVPLLNNPHRDTQSLHVAVPIDTVDKSLSDKEMPTLDVTNGGKTDSHKSHVNRPFSAELDELSGEHPRLGAISPDVTATSIPVIHTDISYSGDTEQNGALLSAVDNRPQVMLVDFRLKEACKPDVQATSSGLASGFAKRGAACDASSDSKTRRGPKALKRSNCDCRGPEQFLSSAVCDVDSHSLQATDDFADRTVRNSSEFCHPVQDITSGSKDSAHSPTALPASSPETNRDHDHGRVLLQTRFSASRSNQSGVKREKNSFKASCSSNLVSLKSSQQQRQLRKVPQHVLPPSEHSGEIIRGSISSGLLVRSRSVKAFNGAFADNQEQPPTNAVNRKISIIKGRSGSRRGGTRMPEDLRVPDERQGLRVPVSDDSATLVANFNSCNGDAELTSPSYQGKKVSRHVKSKGLSDETANHGNDDEHFADVSIREWSCSTCHLTLDNSHRMWRHLKVDHGTDVRFYLCPRCGFERELLFEILKHLHHEHGFGVTELNSCRPDIENRVRYRTLAYAQQLPRGDQVHV